MITGNLTSSASHGDFSLHYKIWGPGNPETLVCVHGLTGNSQDFKFVGEHLSQKGFQVAAIDMAGRGESDYLPDPTDYHFDQYLNDLNLFLKTIGCDGPASCDWLGVSMGGLLGFRLAGKAQSPIRRLILSDIGPEVPQFDLDFIHKVVSSPAPVFKTLDDAIALFKLAAGTPYSRGPLNESQWAYLTRVALKQLPDGGYTRNYDGQIAHLFKTEPLGKENLWSYWEQIHQPTLALRGELSTLFTIRIIETMKDKKPNGNLTVHTIPQSGHVPSLFRKEEIELIESFLLNVT